MLHAPSTLTTQFTISEVTLEQKKPSLFIQKETASIVKVYSQSVNLEKTAIATSSSGIIIDQTGLILTAFNKHPKNKKLVVALADNEFETATILANIPEIGLTLLQLNRLPKNIPTAKVGRLDGLSIGADIQVFNAKEKSYKGKLTGKTARRDLLLHGQIVNYLHIETIEKMSEFTGPLFNAKEELIGFVSAPLLTGGNGNMGVAVGMGTIHRLITEKINH